MTDTYKYKCDICGKIGEFKQGQVVTCPAGCKGNTMTPANETLGTAGGFADAGKTFSTNFKRKEKPSAPSTES